MNDPQKETARFSFDQKTGGWSCYGVRGLRNDVKTKIEASVLPERAKKYLLAKIDTLPDECAGVKVDGYETALSNHHESMLTANTTVVGIKL